MTAQPFEPVDALVRDAERTLEAYADATRITAPSALVRRFQASVAGERAADRGAGPVRRAIRARSVVGGIVVRPRMSPASGVRLALRLQGLVLLLLLALTLGLAAGGAGAAIRSLLDRPWRGSVVPAELLPPPPVRLAPTLTASPEPTPTTRVRQYAQKDPIDRRPTKRRRSDRSARPGPTLAPACLAGPADGMDSVRVPVHRRSCAF